MVAAVGLLVVLAIAMKVVRSRYGKLLQATRDSEDRVRFLGYDPAIVKTVGFVIAAGMAGFAGAIAAPVFGIVSPGQFDYLPSILMVCWVAVGGRGTLWGAVLGALVVNWARVDGERRPARRLAVPAGPAVRGRAGLRARRASPACCAEAARRLVAAVERSDPAPADGDRPSAGGARMTTRPGGPRPGGRVRRLQGARRGRPRRRAGRAALPHRAQRRRQDHAGRLHHRADQAHRRRRALRGQVARAGWPSTAGCGSASAAASRRRPCSRRSRCWRTSTWPSRSARRCRRCSCAAGA